MVASHIRQRVGKGWKSMKNKLCKANTISCLRMETRVVNKVGNPGWELSQIPASKNIRDQKASSKGKWKAVDELLCACFNYPIILRFLCIDLNSSNKALSSPHSLLSIRALSIRYASKERNYSSSRLAWRKGKKKYKWAGMISSAIQYA